MSDVKVTLDDLDKEIVINVKPVNGQILIKEVALDYPLLAINNGSRPKSIGKINYYVVRSDIEEYKEGDSIMVAPNCQMIQAHAIVNPNTLNNIQAILKELSARETEDLMKTRRSFTVVQHLLMHHRDIVGIIE